MAGRLRCVRSTSTFQSLMETKLVKLCNFPSKEKVIMTKWVLHYKPGYKDIEPRYKSRLLLLVAIRSYLASTIWTYVLVVNEKSIQLAITIVTEGPRNCSAWNKNSFSLWRVGRRTLTCCNNPKATSLQVKKVKKTECRLINPLYDLKQQPTVPTQQVDDAILQLNFNRCLYDPCVYYRSLQKDSSLFSKYTLTTDLLVVT
jgi:hypothetical protein